MRQHDAAAAAAQWHAARDVFSRIPPTATHRLQAAARFNAATCLLQLDATFHPAEEYEARVANLRAATDAFEECLERHPSLDEAGKNLDYARYRLNLLLQNPPADRESEDEQEGDEPGVVSEVTTATTEIPNAKAEVVDGSTVILRRTPDGTAP